MDNLIINAKTIADKSKGYLPIEESYLEQETKLMGGNGNITNPYKIKIEITNRSSNNWSGIIHIKYQFKGNDPKFYMPGFMYAQNRGDSPMDVLNEFPRLRSGESNRPASSWWMTRSDRLSHPVSLCYENAKIRGIIGSPYLLTKENQQIQWAPEISGDFNQYCGYTCSIDDCSVGYTLGYEDTPYFFLKSKNVEVREPNVQNCIHLLAGESIKIMVEVIDCSNNELVDINKAIEYVYWKYHQSPRKVNTVKNTVLDLSEAICRDAFLPEYSAYAGQVFEMESGKYRYNNIFSLSWTNGLSVSVPVLAAALRTKNQQMRAQALSSINKVIEDSLNPITKLPYGNLSNGKWDNRGWWFDGMYIGGHSGYLIGQAMYYILKAYELEKNLNNEIHEDWLEYVESILKITSKSTNEVGEYPYVLSEKNGSGIEYDALGSSWLLTAEVYHAFLTSNYDNIDKLIDSEQFYYDYFIKQLECYGGPLDTDKATDSEGVLSFIRAARLMHELTNNQKYLIHLRDALNYEFTFKFCYNSPIKINPLKKIGWSSCGGSITSIANPHIHPMSSTIIDELIYYVEKNNDDYVKSRLIDVICWSKQTYNMYDKEYDFGKKGWMSERFCHSEGLLTQKYNDGSLASTWFCLMPWASASILEGLTGKIWTQTELFNLV